MSTLNERIKTRRKELGLTQKELADILSISDKTVSRWESGNQMPDAMLMPDIAQCLHMSLNELYGINESKFDTDKNCSYDTKYPNEKLWLSISYKLSMILSVFVVLLGCIFKFVDDYNDSSEPISTSGTVLIIIGFVFLLLVEFAYNIIYRDSKIYNPIYLRTDIVFSGIAVLFLIPLLCLTDVIYDLFIALLLAIMYRVVISFQKRKLIEHNIIMSNKASKWFNILFVVYTFLFIAVFVFFKYFYYQYFFNGPDTVAIGLQTMANQSSVSTGLSSPYITYALGLGSMIYLISAIEYINIYINSKQLTLN